MSNRILVLPFILLTFICAVSATWAEDEKKGSAREGKLLEVSGTKLTIRGEDDKKHTFELAPVVEITIDGTKGRLENLKPPMHVKLTLDERRLVTGIKAHVPKK